MSQRKQIPLTSEQITKLKQITTYLVALRPEDYKKHIDKDIAQCLHAAEHLKIVLEKQKIKDEENGKTE